MKFMGKIITIIIVLSMLVFLYFKSFSFASSAKGEIELKFNGQLMSAWIQGVSLRVILEKLKREKGIWFMGNESLLNEKISVRFKDHTLQEGLRRILSHINHGLLFNHENGVVGLFIFSKENPGRVLSPKAATVDKKGLFSQPSGEASVSKKPFETFSDATFPDAFKEKSANSWIREDFSLLENSKTEMSDTTSFDIPPVSKDSFTSPSDDLFADPFGTFFSH